MFYGENCWWGMPMMWFVWLPLIIIAVVMVMRYLKYYQPKSNGDSPLDILKKRYAKGEISREEYEEAKRIIN